MQTSEDWDRQEAEDMFSVNRLHVGDEVFEDFAQWELEVGTWEELKGRLLLSDAYWESRATWQERFIRFSQRTGGAIVYQGPYEPLLYRESLEELLSDGETFDAVIDAYAYKGLKTLVVGLSKAGKSFATWAKSAEAVRSGKRVLYLSEESRGTVLDKMTTFRLLDAYDKSFFVVRRGHDRVRLKTWTEVVEALTQDVKALSIDLVVVDTVRPWVKFESEGSNSDSDVGAAIDALSSVCEAGAAVVVLHQSPWTRETRSRLD